MYQVALSVGWTAMEVTRPDMIAGPKALKRSPLKVAVESGSNGRPSVSGGAGSWACAKPAIRKMA